MGVLYPTKYLGTLLRHLTLHSIRTRYPPIFDHRFCENLGLRYRGAYRGTAPRQGDGPIEWHGPAGIFHARFFVQVPEPSTEHDGQTNGFVPRYRLRYTK